MKLSIRKRVTFLMLACSIGALLLLSIIMFYGMFALRDMAITNSNDISNTSITRSSVALQEQVKQSLLNMAHDKARRIEADIEKLKTDVEIISDEMTKISSYPEEYSPRNVYAPNPLEGGKVVAQLLFSESVQNQNSPALRAEIYHAANIQDFLIHANNFNPMAVSAYIASESGFTIMADKFADRKFRNSPNVPDYFEAFSRPWYQQAAAAQDLIFTDIVEDALGGGPCFICAKPYFRNGNFAGVVGVGSFVRTASEIMKNTKIGKSGFGFILDKHGHVILSAHKFGEIDETNTEDLRTNASETLAAAAKDMTDGVEGISKVLINGKECYIAYSPLRNVQWSFGIIIEAEEVIEPILEVRQIIATDSQEDIQELNSSMNQSAAFMGLSAVIIV